MDDYASELIGLVIKMLSRFLYSAGLIHWPGFVEDDLWFFFFFFTNHDLCPFISLFTIHWNKKGVFLL